MSLVNPAFSNATRNNVNRSTWITFADLMALLLTFFIVILAASNLDTDKFDAITDSMEKVFGVDEKVSDKIVELNPVPEHNPEPVAQEVIAPIVTQRSVMDILKEELALEVKQQRLDIEKIEDKVIIRFPETATFDSASENLKPGLQEVIAKVSTVLQNTSGEIQVSGHADGVPINTFRFRSNWELSSARAVSVVHALLKDEDLDSTRFVAQGFGDSRPISDNTTEKNRHKNRRVEIAITDQEVLVPRKIERDEVSKPEQVPTSENRASSSTRP
ncbi:MAG: OmpA family protein [Gammaproteobacteria bacterium]|nr:OmpA family protein [Gammaproteobacteria bacterium]